MAHREIESIRKKLEDAFGNAEDAESEALRAQGRINAALNQLDTLQVVMIHGPINEALQASMEYMVSKYGHSSKEVKEVEQFIAHGTTPRLPPTS